MREIINLNADWCFCKTAVCPDTLPEEWEPISLPHTWNAQDGQDGGNDYWRGTAMYAKRFSRPSLGERVFLEVNGAAMTAEVFVNGKRAAAHQGGYAAFRADITDLLEEENLLCISVDNGVNDCVYPQKADFTFYGGLYRDVNLICVPEAHFELEKDGTPGIRVTPVVDLEKKRAVVTMETWQKAPAGGAENTQYVTIRIGDEEKRVLSAEGHAAAEFVLEDVRLWDGLKDPWLYTAAASLESGDEISARFGCRKMEFDPQKGFLLNGRSYPLRGVSRHQDRRGVGNALTLEMHREDIDIIREIGANTVRLAHYQHAQEFYDLCDEYGLVVWAEIPYITQHMPGGRQNTLDQMRELITQCYNHPCIACWGLSNEITASGTASGDLMENHRLLNDLCHRMDPTRPTTMAHVFMLETDSPLVQLPDIGSYNLYFGWYLGELEQNEKFFDEYHQKYPERVIGFSEYGADANPAFHSARPERGDYSEEYQCLYHEHLLKCMEGRPWLWATHVWNLFDFAADGRDEGGAHGVNQKGLVTMDRQVKKDAFYLYKAAWSRDPFVHLCGSRYVDRAEEVTEVKVYSNQPEVALFVDGKKAGNQKGRYVFSFRVAISGEHLIEARSGPCTDQIRIRKVEQPNPSYQFARDGGIVNWFDKEDFREGYYSIRDTFGELLANPKTAELVGKIMAQARKSRGEVAQSAQGNANLTKMMGSMSFQSILKQAGEAVSREQVKELNGALQLIPKQ